MPKSCLKLTITHACLGACVTLSFAPAASADSPVMSAAAGPLPPATPHTGSDVSPESPAPAEEMPLDTILKAEVAADSDLWTKYYLSALKALEYRIYPVAKRRLLAAEKECTSANSGMNARLARTRIAQAEVLAVTDEVQKAERLVDSVLSSARKLLPSADLARALHLQSSLAFLQGKYAQAESTCKKSLAMRERAFGQDSAEVAQSCLLLAKILAAEGWTEEAEPLFQRSLTIFQKKPGPQRLDLADALREQALFYQSRGRLQQSKPLFEESSSIREAATRFDQPITLRGLVTLPWDAGAPGSLEVPDAQYPLRYVNAGQLRVAATLVGISAVFGARVYGALISIANTTPHYVDIGVGPVGLEMLRPSTWKFPELELNPIDRCYLERAVWDLTWKRPALANIQRTRASIGRLRGESPDISSDYGGNVFGMYGDWGLGPRSLPEIVNRERMHARGESVLLPGVASASSIGVLDLRPVTIAPYESRTGIIFFPYRPFQRAVLKVSIGNACFEFPYKTVEAW
ncbi:MAG TPA: tetratricopeptide repeat protein [Candidatus Obscuribacterales bacterium]